MQVKREGVIKFGYDFNNLDQVLGIWGAEVVKNPYLNFFRIPGCENVVGVLLSESAGKGWKHERHCGLVKDGRGWREILSIDEFNAKKEESVNRINEELANPVDRYVFWHESKDGTQWYKFYGVFKLDVEATKSSLETDAPKCVYRRAADSAPTAEGK